MSVSLNLALVTQLVVPRLGDWCVAYSVDDRGRPRRLTVNHRNEERTDAVRALLDNDAELRQTIRGVAAGTIAQRVPTTVPVAGQRNFVTVLPLHSRDRTHLRALATQGSRDPRQCVSRDTNLYEVTGHQLLRG